VGAYASQGLAHEVRVVGSFAFMATSEGLEIVDVTDPGAPAGVAHLGGGEAWGVDVRDGLAYLAVPATGLKVVDVRDPSSPREIGTVSGTQMAWDVHVHEGFAYVGCHEAGVRILAVSANQLPQVIGRYLDDDGGEALGVWGDGEYLYVADNFAIEVLDVRDPAALYEIGEVGRVHGAHGLDVNGMWVYVAEARKGLMILEFQANPPP
jgi:hypothetical protein